MMKLQSSLKVACMAMAALTAFGCSQDELVGQSALKGNTTIKASFEGAGADTRTSIKNDKDVVWNKNDAFGLFYTTAANTTTPTVTSFTCSNADGNSTEAEFYGNLSEGATTSYAVYPYQADMSLSNSTVTMKLPETFDYTTASNGPMYAPATDTDIDDGLRFKHLAGLLKLTVTNKIGTAAKKFVITADKNIAGTCTADLSATSPVLAVASEGSTSISIALSFEDTNTKNTIFYVPIPVGTYGTLSAKLLKEGDVELYAPKEWKNITVARADMLMATFGYVTIDATAPAEIGEAIAKELPSEAPEAPITTDIQLTGKIDATTAGNATVTIPAIKNSNVNLALAVIPKTEDSKPLVLETKDAGTSAEAVNTVSIAIPAATKDNAPSITITMPTTTVELGISGTATATVYKKIIAKTASNTIVIKKGVTVENLVVAGGNVKVEAEGTIKAISKANGFTDDVIIFKENGATIPESHEGFTVVDNMDEATYFLMKAAEKGGAYTLNSNVELTEPLVVVKDMKLDLNGYSITQKGDALKKVLNTQDALILVRRGATLTIEGNAASSLISSAGKDNIATTIKLTDSNDQSEYEHAGEPAKLIVNSGTIRSKAYAISGNGTRDNTALTINGGNIVSTDDYAIYSPQQGTTTISGGTISGAGGGIAIQDGTLNISGNAVLTSEGTMSYDNSEGDGTRRLLNAAVCVPARYGECTVNITGGTFISKGTSTDIDDTYGKVQTSTKKTITISGGTFSDPSVIDYVAENANVNVTLNRNVEITKSIVLNKANAEVTFNLNGKDILNQTLTTKEEVKETHTNIFEIFSGTLNIEGEGKVQCIQKSALTDYYNCCIPVWAKGTGIVNIKGGSFYNKIEGASGEFLDLIYVSGTGTVNVSGGTFESGCHNRESVYWVLNKSNGAKLVTTMNVTGGTFINFNPASPNTDDDATYVATGYEVKCGGEVATEHYTGTDRKIYTVVPKAAAE